MEFFKTNLNNYIKVKLKPEGVEIYRKYHVTVFGDSLEDYLFDYKVDEDGYFKIQLWRFVNIFGEYMVMGYEMPFDLNVMIQSEED